MKITILTLFPEMFHDFLNTSIVARSIQKGLAEVEIVDIRDYATGSFRHVDDSPIGGGAGMILKCQPVLDCLNDVSDEHSHRVLFTPTGNTWNQAKAHNFSELDHIVLLCGHYEGIDARVYDHVDELLSIGDYVLTGGELPAMIVTDSVIRLLKGSIKEESAGDESYENGLLEYPQYTQPADYHGEKVPDVLLSGHHEKIRRWRLKESLRLTKDRRPDLFIDRSFTDEERRYLQQIEEEEVAHVYAEQYGLWSIGGQYGTANKTVVWNGLWFTDHVQSEQIQLLKPYRILTDQHTEYDYLDVLNQNTLHTQLEVFFTSFKKSKPTVLVAIQDQNLLSWIQVLLYAVLGVDLSQAQYRYEHLAQNIIREIETEMKSSQLSIEQYLEQFGLSAKDRRRIRLMYLED